MDVRRVPAKEGDGQRWFDFLAAECTRRDGLLCFYDLEKSPQVVFFCQLLGRRLKARAALPASAVPGPGREEEPCPFTLPGTFGRTD